MVVTRTPGYFDYWDVTGKQIEAAADGPAGHAAILGALAEDLDIDGRRARTATEGDISGMVARDPAEAGSVARSLAQNGVFAVACLRKFAGEVDLFDTRVNRLNVQIAELALSYRSFPLLVEPLGTWADLRGRKIAELRPRYLAAETDLDDAADLVADWLKQGPTEKLLHVMVRNGLMPLAAGSYFPQLVFNGADVYLAMAAQAAAGLVPRWVLAQGPESLDAYLTKHHGVAARLVDQLGDLSSDGSSLTALTGLLVMPMYGAKAPRMDDLLAHTSSGERRRLAMLLPAFFGNNSEAPFEMRAQANRVRISAQIHDDAIRMSELDKEIGRYAGSDHPAHDAIDERKRLEKRADTYEHLLNDIPAKGKDKTSPDHRQIILFDPRGDGTMAEVHGLIDKNTEGVGVYVPGTGHGLDDWSDSASRSESFRKNSSRLAMVTWIGSDLPDNVVLNAPNQGYAKEAGPLLSEFSQQLRTDMERSGAGSASTAYLGHSYGGAIVGEAEHYGLSTDRVVMVESAGMGPSVKSVEDLAPENRTTPHYSLTASDDVINIVQGSGHLGADPDEFGNNVRLQTGYFSNGDRIDGPIASHSDVFNKDSDAWNNMMSGLVGGTATRWHPDEIHGDAHLPSYESGGEVKIR